MSNGSQSWGINVQKEPVQVVTFWACPVPATGPPLKLASHPAASPTLWVPSAWAASPFVPDGMGTAVYWGSATGTETCGKLTFRPGQGDEAGPLILVWHPSPKYRVAQTPHPWDPNPWVEG